MTHRNGKKVTQCCDAVLQELVHLIADVSFSRNNKNIPGGPTILELVYNFSISTSRIMKH